MNKVLSILLVFVLLQVQTWALSGGPVYTNSVALSGTYAGVLSGIISTAPPLPGFIDSGNSLGVFVIGVPKTDVAQGTIALFADGVFYQGGMLGIADPVKLKLSAIAQLVHVSSSDKTQTDINISYDSREDGKIEMKITPGANSQGSGFTTLSGNGSFNVANLVIVPQTTTVIDPITGIPTSTTTLVPTFPPAGKLSFSASGYKQSTDVISPKANSIADLLNGTGTNAPTTPTTTP